MNFWKFSIWSHATSIKDKYIIGLLFVNVVFIACFMLTQLSLWTKSILITKLLCTLLFLLCSHLPSQSGLVLCSVLSGPSQRSEWKPEGFLESNLRGGRQEYKNIFFFFWAKRKSSNWNEGIPQITDCHKVILLPLDVIWNGVNMEINS